MAFVKHLGRACWRAICIFETSESQNKRQQPQIDVPDEVRVRDWYSKIYFRLKKMRTTGYSKCFVPAGTTSPYTDSVCDDLNVLTIQPGQIYRFT